jgi:hypothetical protein
MRKVNSNTADYICFRKWSRKAYAIFSSLGISVRIGHLSVDVCEMSSHKLSKLFSVWNEDFFVFNINDILNEYLRDEIEMQMVEGESMSCRNLHLN